MSSYINSRSLDASSDEHEIVRDVGAMDSGPAQSYVNQSSLNSGRASAWLGLKPYFHSDSADIPDQAMDAFWIASEDLGPAGRWIVEAVLRPLSDHIWNKIQHCDQYCMTKKEMQIFAFFELEYPENKREFIKAAKMRYWLEICRSLLGPSSRA